MAVSDYDEKAHLQDFIRINARLKEEIKNWKFEHYCTTKEQLEYRLKNWFSDEKIERLKK